MNKETKKDFEQYLTELYYTKLLIGFQADQSDGARYESFEQWLSNQDLEEQVTLCDGDYASDLKEYQNGECSHDICPDHHVCLNCDKCMVEELADAAEARAQAAMDDRWHDRNGR